MRTVVFIFICVFFQLTVSAQTEYLYQIGKKDSLFSNVLNESREIYVHIPESYQSKTEETYPVVYILDGDVLLPTAVNVHDYYSGGFMPEMIIVGISNAENRTRDLTTSKITSRRGMPYNKENGKADNFLEFIKTELIPYVEGKYPVTNYRTLIGHSYAGLFTIYTLLNKPELFENYISIDPSLDWDDQKLLKQAESIFLKNDYKGKGLFMSLGCQLHMQNADITIDNVMQDTSEYTLFARSNMMFSNVIEENPENSLFYKWQFYPNDLHGTIPQPSIKDGLIALFEWFQMESMDKINSPETSIEELLNVINHREEKLKKHFSYHVPPYPEYLFNMLGYMNIDMEQLDKSKMYFEQAIKYYPKSANAYDSMADYYEAITDYKNTLKYVALAYKISGNDYHKERLEKLKARN
ncbi:alpha/beta hydrolase-fold protein [Formosa maritima]|uniref:Alpha/beta hydrolase n=1 Tax=Formosa maritima TaxID=2592046 RepID=A0A5D0GK23_9FLAO|nr:alpha/beta hydrolase-fold protein [Formosa maritima]TYA59293.1 alpha/beta hydrolase [Formosa maritima]